MLRTTPDAPSALALPRSFWLIIVLFPHFLLIHSHSSTETAAIPFEDWEIHTFFYPSKPLDSWDDVTYGPTIPWIFWISCNLCNFVVPMPITAWFWFVSLWWISPTLFMWNKNSYLETKDKMRLYSAFNNPDMIVSLEQNLHIHTSSVCHLFLWAQNWIMSS